MHLPRAPGLSADTLSNPLSLSPARLLVCQGPRGRLWCATLPTPRAREIIKSVNTRAGRSVLPRLPPQVGDAEALVTQNTGLFCSGGAHLAAGARSSPAAHR